MTLLIDPHDPVEDCDCHDCALAERNRLRLCLYDEKEGITGTLRKEEHERMRNRIEHLRGALKSASGWCFDMTSETDKPEHNPQAHDWLIRSNLLLKWAGDMEKPIA